MVSARRLMGLLKALAKTSVVALTSSQSMGKGLSQQSISLNDQSQGLHGKPTMHSLPHSNETIRTTFEAVDIPPTAASSYSNGLKSSGLQSCIDNTNCIPIYMPGFYLVPTVPQELRNDGSEDSKLKFDIQTTGLTIPWNRSQTAISIPGKDADPKFRLGSDKANQTDQADAKQPQDEKKMGFLKRFFSPHGWCMDNVCHDPKWLNTTCNLTSIEFMRLPGNTRNECLWCFPHPKETALKAHCKNVGDSMEKALYGALGALGGLAMVSLVLIFLTQ
ncbi:uncharacterized protein KY384_002211 [Bacidia gigantensis]|uniref:uncharacterized protein n=1 Tax=Bacidia gigantensis TaxID=2732470 RepID=UPI001D058427|nr:uncharacterized protein KY384_002211 [Bacidia gigantensis]KAG8533428.1 hypothetical protein KY384_002211 [Bacidia gigantensis]